MNYTYMGQQARKNKNLFKNTGINASFIMSNIIYRHLKQQANIAKVKFTSEFATTAINII